MPNVNLSPISTRVIEKLLGMRVNTLYKSHLLRMGNTEEARTKLRAVFHAALDKNLDANDEYLGDGIHHIKVK